MNINKPYKDLLTLMTDQRIRRETYLTAIALGDMHEKDIDTYHKRLIPIEKQEDRIINRCIKAFKMR